MGLSSVGEGGTVGTYLVGTGKFAHRRKAQKVVYSAVPGGKGLPGAGPRRDYNSILQAPLPSTR